MAWQYLAFSFSLSFFIALTSCSGPSGGKKTKRECSELNEINCTKTAIPNKPCVWRVKDRECVEDNVAPVFTKCSELSPDKCVQADVLINKTCEITPTGLCADKITTPLVTRIHCSQLTTSECTASQPIIAKNCVTNVAEPKCREATAKVPGVVLKDLTPPPPLERIIPTSADATGWVRHASSAPNAQAVQQETKANGQGAKKIPKLMAYAEKTINSVARKISVVYGDIVKETTQGAIVNAANGSLTGGGGVDGAIHAGAGAALAAEGAAYRELFTPGNFMTGSAMVANAYNLDNATHDIQLIVNTVSPGGETNTHKEHQNYSAFYNSMKKASEYSMAVVSFPSLGTGIFGFPINVATELFFRAALQFFKDYPASSIKEIRITNFDEPTVIAYLEKFNVIFK